MLVVNLPRARQAELIKKAVKCYIQSPWSVPAYCSYPRHNSELPTKRSPVGSRFTTKLVEKQGSFLVVT